jgi:hypothetical protein
VLVPKSPADWVRPPCRVPQTGTHTHMQAAPKQAAPAATLVLPCPGALPPPPPPTLGVLLLLLLHLLLLQLLL